jgi:hypothetical protein
MPCEIADVYGYRNATGTLVGIQAAEVYAVPSTPLLSVDYAGTWRPLNGLNPLISGSATFRYGVVSQTDATGAWSFTLPYGATETAPATPLARWTLVFPDGNALFGVVPSVAGPLGVYDLITSHGWVWANNVYVAPVTAGTFAKGTAVFVGGAATATIVFSSPFSANTYQVSLTPSVDSNDGSVPRPGWSSKTTTGFTINVDATSFTGSVDWEAKL